MSRARYLLELSTYALIDALISSGLFDGGTFLNEKQLASSTSLTRRLYPAHQLVALKHVQTYAIQVGLECRLDMLQTSDSVIRIVAEVALQNVLLG